MLQLLATVVASRLHREEDGATAVEYGLMVALIAAVIIAAVTALGVSLQDIFGFVSGEVTSVVPAGDGG